MTFENNLDPDEAQQNVGPHLRSKLFDTHIIYQQKNRIGMMNFFNSLTNCFFIKYYLSLKRVRTHLALKKHIEHKKKVQVWVSARP